MAAHRVNGHVMDVPALPPIARFDALVSDCPLFAGLQPHRGIFVDPDSVDMSRLLVERDGHAPLRFAAQTPALLADGLHYEQRIAERGVIATREHISHDLFNAVMWLRHAALKRAMNSRQVADIAHVGPKQRTRGQCALTHFDEGGAIAWVCGEDLVDAWSAHDWRTLFVTHRAAWGSRIALTVIGHALFDHVFDRGELPVARALVVRVDAHEIASRSSGALIASWPDAERKVADAIAASRVLTDPQELRPLPLAGIPGWHVGEQCDDFYATAPCFRPLRPGRCYPRPLEFAELNGPDASGAAREQAATG